MSFHGNHFGRLKKKQKVYILFSMRLIIGMSMKSVYHIFWFWVPLSFAGFLGIFFLFGGKFLAPC